MNPQSSDSVPTPHDGVSEPNSNDTNALSWREQKSLNASHLAQELERRQQRESAQAKELIAEFLVAAQAKNVLPTVLYARGYNGSARYKTKVLGWYLKQNESLAIDTQGNFYVLSVPGGILARFTGVTLTPSEPPLVLGFGGRDGESIDLKEALERILS